MFLDFAFFALKLSLDQLQFGVFSLLLSLNFDSKLAAYASIILEDF
jgi:hypothetical protein